MNRAITKNVFAQAVADPDDAEEYERVRQAIITRATAIRNRRCTPPKPEVSDPPQPTAASVVGC